MRERERGWRRERERNCNGWIHVNELKKHKKKHGPSLIGYWGGGGGGGGSSLSDMGDCVMEGRRIGDDIHSVT